MQVFEARVLQRLVFVQLEHVNAQKLFYLSITGFEVLQVEALSNLRKPFL
jgi:hypothetical protein